MHTRYKYITLFFLLSFGILYAQRPQNRPVSQTNATNTASGTTQVNSVSDNNAANQQILFPPTEDIFTNSDGIQANSFTANDVVGAIPGHFAVSPSGAATYTIPIEVPPGINGMQPNISLVYNSQSRNGIAGWGWNINGISMISRVPRNPLFDSDKTGIIWGNTSPFALDGQRLVVMQTFGTDSIVYDTESVSGKRIVGYNIQDFGPQYFRVYTQSGQVIQYGNPNNAASYFPVGNTSEGFRHLGWAIVSVTDNNDNTINYHYENNSQSIPTGRRYFNNRLNSITYGTNALVETGTSLMNVQFEYRNMTTPHISTYIDGMLIQDTRILSGIQTFVNNELINTYTPTYEIRQNKYHLQSITLSNSNNEHLRPTRFAWDHEEFNNSALVHNQLSFNISDIPGFAEQGNVFSIIGKMFGDLNGDGLTDVVVQLRHDTNGRYYWAVFLQERGTDGQPRYRYIHHQRWFKEENDPFLFLFDGDRSGRDKLYVLSYLENLNDFSCMISFYEYTNSKMTRRRDFEQPRASITREHYHQREHSVVIPMDIRGNGQIEFLVKHRINGNNNSTRLSLINRCSNGLTPPLINLNIDGGNNSSRIFLTDINGNGKPEIMHVRSNGTTHFYEYVWTAEEIIGFTRILDTGIFSHTDKIYIGDFNGDGNTDFLVRKSGFSIYEVHISNGNSLIKMPWGDMIDSQNTDFAPSVLLMDVNQDGLTDIILNNRITTNRSQLSVYTSTGNGFVRRIAPFEITTNRHSGHYLTDIGAAAIGTGSAANRGVVLREDAAENQTAGYTTFSNHFCHMSLNFGQFNKINHIDDGLNSRAIFYRNMLFSGTPRATMGYTNRNSSATGISYHLPIDLEVVSSTSTTAYENLRYVFRNPRIHWAGRGFLGFSDVDVFDYANSTALATSQVVCPTFHIMYPRINTKHWYDGARRRGVISEEIFDYSVVDRGRGRYFLSLNSVASRNNVTNLRDTVRIYYDSWTFNPWIIEKTTGDVVETQTITYTQRNEWSPNRPLSIKTERRYHGVLDPNPVFVEFQYDNRGNLTRETRSHGSDEAFRIVTEYRGHNAFGQPGRISVHSGNKTHNTTQTFASSGRFMTSTANVLERTTYQWDETRALLTETTDHYGRTTKYTYDNWGKLTKTRHPDGITERSELRWAPFNNIGARFFSRTEIDGRAPIYVWYNAAGQEVLRESFGLNNQRIRIFSQYDGRSGKLLQVSAPTFDNTHNNNWDAIYTYDQYGRITTVNTPMGETRYEYGRLPYSICERTPRIELTNTIHTPQGTTSTTLNRSGVKVRSTINGKWVDYTYHPSGLLRTATPQDGVAVSTYYDPMGRRIKLNDPNAGIVRSEYNGFGELLWTSQRVHNATDSVLTEYSYLANGLLQFVTRTGQARELVFYHYDNNHRISFIAVGGPPSTPPGLPFGSDFSEVLSRRPLLPDIGGPDSWINLIMDATHTQTFTYDEFDRVTNVREEIDGRTFNRSTEFDKLGRVVREIYPTGFYTRNIFDQHSNLIEIRDRQNRLIWKPIEENARGQIIAEKRGTVITNRTFDQRGFPEFVQAGDLMDVWYQFDERGNLVHRDDYANYIYNEVGVPQISPQIEYFEYDNLNRLTAWTVGALDNNHNMIKEVRHTQAYDHRGNIHTRSDLDNFIMNYGEGHNKPHALTSVLGRPSHFPTATLAVTYTDFKKIKTLEEGNRFYEITYGVDNQRRKSVLSVNGELQITRYYFGDFEKVFHHPNQITEEIHYFRGAVLVRNSSPWWDPEDTFYYTYTDYLGSLTALVHENGRVAQRYAYDPWGMRRNPYNWTERDTRTNFILNRGYTGHEHIDEFGIINMNGRVYDPLTAQFFSPDPFIQAPDYWLNFNRYSYVWNNPFRYTDPSGNIVLEILFMGIMIYNAGVQTNFNHNMENNTSPFNPGNWNWSNPWTYINMATAAVSAYGLVNSMPGGLRDRRQDLIFKRGLEKLGINAGDPVPATDEFLSQAQKAWYRKAPMDKIPDNFTTERVPFDIQISMDRNNAPASTRPIWSGTGKNRTFSGYSDVFFNRNLAFTDAKTLFHTMGHEFVHVSQIAALAGECASLWTSSFRAMLDFHAYQFQSTLPPERVGLNSFTQAEIRSWRNTYSRFFQPMGWTNFQWTFHHSFRYPF